MENEAKDNHTAGLVAESYDDLLPYWTDEQVDKRNASLRIAPERKAEILSDVAGMTERIDVFRYSQSLKSEAKSDFIEAIVSDVRRRDGLGDAGWADARRNVHPPACDGISSFRLGHASLIGLIGCDYDGCADPRTRKGNAEALASLADELAEMAAFAYANVPSRYYPLDIENGIWTIRDIMTRNRKESHRGRLRVPLSCLASDEGEMLDGDNTSDIGTLLEAEWWGMFLASRAEEARRGLIIPLPAACQSDEDGDDVIGTDGGVMLSCANVLRHWESVKDDVPSLVKDNDTHALCNIVDTIVGYIDSDVTMSGWR